MMNTKKTAISGSLKYVLLIFFTILFLYPILWLLINAFKTNEELFLSPWSLPKSLSLVNFARAITEGNLGRYFINSVVVSSVVVVMATLLSAMAAYGITRLHWKLSGLVLSVFLLGMMIPTYSTIIPLFSIFNKLKINNTYMAVIIPHIVFALPIAILILSGFFAAIPKELEEAAVIDGAGRFRQLLHITLPCIKSTIIILLILRMGSLWIQALTRST
jgi:raffinose/stachyose/melibiose transport system permease protein